MNYDQIIVGSSPLSLVFAAQQARAGLRIAVYEQNSRIGGAWAVDNALGYKDVETSPHVFLPAAGAYEKLDYYLDSRFEDLEIQPILKSWPRLGIIPSREVSIGDFGAYKKLLTFEQVLNTPWTKPKPLWRRLQRFRKACFYETDAPTTLRYPSGGLVGMFERAAKRLRASGVELLTGNKVQSIRLRGEQVEITDQFGQRGACSRLFLNRHVEVSSIETGSETVIPKLYERVSFHYVLLISKTPKRGFMQFCGRAPLVFVNDVTDYAADPGAIEDDCRLICARAAVGLHLSLAEVVSNLKQAAYLPENAELVRGTIEKRAIKKLHRDSIRRLNSNFSPQLEFLLTDDFSLMDSVARYLDRDVSGADPS
jgi:hypothetical protein